MRPPPALVIAILALVAGLTGTAVAGDQVASTSLSKKKTKKLAKRIATKQINKLAPGLSVASAERANEANSARQAAEAESAENARNAQNAQSAANAGDADLLDGIDSGELTQIGGVFDAVCDPEPGLGFVDCDPAPLGVTKRTSDILVTVTAEWYDAEVAGGSSRAECRFERNGGVISGVRELGAVSDVTDEDHKLSVAMSHIDFDRPPGPHSYSLSCQESEANLVLHNVHTVARTLGG